MSTNTEDMLTMTVKLDSIEKVKRFVSIIELTEIEVDLKQRRYIVDAKSVLGIFSFDLNLPILVQFHSTDEKIVDTLKEKLKEFEVNESVQV